MKTIDFKTLEDEIYRINRVVSLSIAFEKDIKKQNKYTVINRLLSEAIKQCRD